jgi:hypothetical protein
VCKPLDPLLGSRTGQGPQFDINGVTYDASAKTLRDLGIVCYDIDPQKVYFGASTFDAQREFDSIVRDAVELKYFEHVLGGFAAINYATFFHHEKVRLWREQIFSRALQLELFDPNLYVAMGFDRMLYRLPSQQPSAECMHRDISPLKTDGDVYGGWFNMTTESQFIRCAPGTHTDDPKGDEVGFAALKDPADKLHYKELMQTIEIKPLHVMMFNQKLVHEILAKKSKHVQIRLFMCLYTSRSRPEVLHGNQYLEDVFEQQSVPLLPSGQKCASFPSVYANYPRNYKTLNDYCAKTFNPPVLHTVVANYTDPVTKLPLQTNVVRPGRMVTDSKGNTKFHAQFPSLKELGNMLPAYGSVEKNAYYPSKTHSLFTVHDTTQRHPHTVNPVIHIT